MYAGLHVKWGFAVDNATLTRFFALHFLIPFAIAAVTIIKIGNKF